MCIRDREGACPGGPEVLGLAEGVDVVPEQRAVLSDDNHAEYL